MGTKQNPGTYDCYSRAEPDEPMFILLARDPTAPELVRDWADKRLLNRGETDPKVAEAYALADEMDKWRKEHRL